MSAWMATKMAARFKEPLFDKEMGFQAHLEVLRAQEQLGER